MDYSNIQERTQWTLNILPPLILKFFKTNIALAQWQSSKFKVILRQNTASSDCITGVSFWKGNNRFLFSINWFGYQLLENRKKVGLFSRNRLTFSVSNRSESESALFRAKKRPKFFFQKAPQFWSKAPQFEIFPIEHEVENDPPNHFYCIFMWQFLPEQCKTVKLLKF